MNAEVEEYIHVSGEKLKTLLIPLIRADYPEVDEKEINLLFKITCGSVGDWYAFMSRWVIPHRDEIKELPEEETQQMFIELPQIVPGINLKRVPYETYRKVNGILLFYLNLYDHVDKCLIPPKSN